MRQDVNRVGWFIVLDPKYSETQARSHWFKKIWLRAALGTLPFNSPAEHSIPVRILNIYTGKRPWRTFISLFRILKFPFTSLSLTLGNSLDSFLAVFNKTLLWHYCGDLKTSPWSQRQASEALQHNKTAKDISRSQENIRYIYWMLSYF